jgi:hypothetical protein
LEKISLLLKVIGPTLPLLDFLGLLILLLLHPDLVIPDALNSLLKIIDFLILLRVIRILLIELINELSEFLLLSFDVDVITLEVFILLLS